MILVITLILSPRAAQAITARGLIREKGLNIDPVAADLMESLGELTHLDAAFLTRISALPQKEQKALAVRLATDGHITVAELKKVPLPVVIPDDPADLIVSIIEQIREDYWRGWYKRHSLSARVKMQHWKETAARRFVNPEKATRLIDIFFQKLNGTYQGPKVIY